MLTRKPKARTWTPYVLAFILILAALALGASLLKSARGKVLEAPQTAKPQAPKPQTQNLTDVSTFRMAYIKANGGEHKLAALNSIQTRGTFESGGNTVPFRTIKRRPDKSITTLQMPDYELSFVVNGRSVWQRVEQRGLEPVDTMKEGQEADAMRELGHFFDPFMHVVLSEPKSILSMEATTWEGEPALSLEFKSDSRNMHATVILNPRTLNPILRKEEFADGRTREVFYSDYRSIDGGIREPFQVETYMDAELQSRLIVESCTINVGAPGFLFEFKEPESESGI